MAIIGVGGKIGSGKDTVGAIIQYLVFRDVYKDEIFSTEGEKNFNIYQNSLKPLDSTFKIKKFADYLKDIVCGLINCTREQLEDPVFKDTELGEEWTKYSYADGFWSHSDNNPSHKRMDSIQCTRAKYIEEHSTNWQTAYKTVYTPRILLQQIGTELFRNQLLNDIWVNALMSKYLPIENSMRASMGNVIDYSDCIYPNWIITDVRFPNELQAVKNRRGISIRVNRGRTGGEILEDKNSEHPSETSLDAATFDYVIHNDDSIEELIERVREILIKEKII